MRWWPAGSLPPSTCHRAWKGDAAARLASRGKVPVLEHARHSQLLPAPRLLHISGPTQLHPRSAVTSGPAPYSAHVTHPTAAKINMDRGCRLLSKPPSSFPQPPTASRSASTLSRPIASLPTPSLVLPSPCFSLPSVMPSPCHSLPSTMPPGLAPPFHFTAEPNYQVTHSTLIRGDTLSNVPCRMFLEMAGCVRRRLPYERCALYSIRWVRGEPLVPVGSGNSSGPHMLDDQPLLSLRMDQLSYRNLMFDISRHLRMSWRSSRALAWSMQLNRCYLQRVLASAVRHGIMETAGSVFCVSQRWRISIQQASSDRVETCLRLGVDLDFAQRGL